MRGLLAFWKRVDDQFEARGLAVDLKQISGMLEGQVISYLDIMCLYQSILQLLGSSIVFWWSKCFLVVCISEVVVIAYSYIDF